MGRLLSVKLGVIDQDVLVVVQFFPIARQGEFALHGNVQMPRVVVFFQQQAVSVVGLGILVGEELALAQHEQGVFFQGRIGPAIGGRFEFVRRFGEFLLLEQFLAFFKGRPGDALVRTVTGRLFNALPHILRGQFRPEIVILVLHRIGHRGRRGRRIGQHLRRRSGYLPAAEATPTREIFPMSSSPIGSAATVPITAEGVGMPADGPGCKGRCLRDPCGYPGIRHRRRIARRSGCIRRSLGWHVRRFVLLVLATGQRAEQPA